MCLVADRSGSMNTTTYLERIGYTGPTTPTLETLRGLHHAHLTAVPFENLDIHLSRRIELDICSIYEKIVNGRRGGFCYEVNGLFAELLRSLGFTVRLLSARYVTQDGGRGPAFDHLLVMVEMEQPWIADVAAFREPYGLDEERCELDGRCSRISQRGDEYILARKDIAHDWADNWAFTLESRRFDEFAGMCHYHQTNPDSHFMRNRICSRATADSRISLINDLFITTDAHSRTEQPVKDVREWERMLREQFGVVLPAAEMLGDTE